MRLSRFAPHLFLAAALAAPGCVSDPPAAVYEFPKETLRKERVAIEAPPPAAHLVDVDKLRAELERAMPPGWTIEDPDDQIEAPAGWERIDGARGMAVKLVDHRRTGGLAADPYFVLYLFPHGWTGRDLAQGVSVEGDTLVKLPKARPDCAATDDPVVFYGESDDWLFFHSTKGHKSSTTTVAAGWNKPEDDVAHALRIERR